MLFGNSSGDEPDSSMSAPVDGRDSKSKAAFVFASQTLGEQQLYLWTFTFKGLLAVKETRKPATFFLTNR
jgi:hypothetical protein